MSRIFRGIIMGAPGSGKGTIAARIIKHFNVKHVSSGDLLRAYMQEASNWGTKARAYVESGQLVPDDMMVEMMEKALLSVGHGSWLLDGFPRTRWQAEVLLSKHNVNGVINLVVPYEVILDRVKGRWIHEPSGRVYNMDFNAPKVPGLDDVTGEALVQRVDDRPETVRRRLEIYSSMTKPILELCDQAGILNNFYGSKTDGIWPNVLNYLKEQMVPSVEL
ncbi:hypothetical protein PR048_026555 [Dryococelus australis]|uniref:GTP:AMP phosphotransferase, mitochondrial n=1 Tax=Dryococelus australis TaxID=614101 RepID=A0ABQ9GLP8_9NEOP|nr:hypothetical protein PR048_026555 [Dryococelus australis]